jgi:hypothetical protein
MPETRGGSRSVWTSVFALIVAAAGSGAAHAQPGATFGVDEVEVESPQPRVLATLMNTRCCGFCGRQQLEAIVPQPDGPRRRESDGGLPLRRKFCGTVMGYGVNDETADPRDILLNILPLAPERTGSIDKYGPFVAGFYKTASTPLTGDPLESVFDHHDCDVQRCLDAARTRPNKQIHAEITPANEFYGVDRRFLPIDDEGECSDGWNCSSMLENARSEVCVYGVYAMDHGSHPNGDHLNLCCAPDPGHDHPEIHPFDAIWWRHHERDGWIFGVFQDDSNRYSSPYCEPRLDDAVGWSQAPRDVTLKFPFRFGLSDAPMRAVVRRFSTPPLSGGAARQVVPLNVTTAARANSSDEVKTLRVGDRVVLVVEEEAGTETETWINVVGGLPGHADSPLNTVSGFVIVRVAVGCGKFPGSNMRCSPSEVQALAPAARVAKNDIGSGFYYGEVVFDRPRRCTREEAAVPAARATLQARRDELRNLQAELERETSPAVRKSIQKLITQLRTKGIPEAERALAAAEAALAACAGG